MSEKAGIANRTINMDVGALSRVLKLAGRWRALEEHVELLPERAQEIGRALTSDEQQRLFEAATSNRDWAYVYCAAVVAVNTSMRRIEVVHLRRRDVDLFNKTVTIRRSKNESSHRIIPLNNSALKSLARTIERADMLPFCSRPPTIPARRIPERFVRFRNSVEKPSSSSGALFFSRWTSFCRSHSSTEIGVRSTSLRNATFRLVTAYQSA